MKRIIAFLWRYRLISTIIILSICGWFVYSSVQRFVGQFEKQKKDLAIKLQNVNKLETTNDQLVQEVANVRHTTSEQLRHASDSIFKLKDKANRLIKDVSRLEIIAQAVRLKDTVFAPFPDSLRIPADITCDSLKSLMPNLVHTPINWEYTSDSFSITAIMNNDGVAIVSLDIPNTLYERDVVRKSGLFNLGRKHTTEFYNSNSMLSINGAAVYTVDKTPSWWYRTGKPVGVGIISAALASIIVYSISPK